MRVWSELYRLKDMLPRGSHYKTAIALDDEIAEQMADLPESNEPPSPLGYTTDTYLLLTIIDSLQSVQAAIIAAAGGKPPHFSPMKRPWTALDGVRERRYVKKMNSLIDRFIHPSKRGNG
ncbi:hypothetical protein ACWEQ4_01300 [Rhodococcus sp. NPDC003994]